MTRSAVNETAAWMVKQITTARVFDAAQISPYLAEFKGQNRTGNARQLADFLIANQLLTPFQVERILAEEAHKLVMGPYLLANPLGSGSLGNVFQAIGRSDRKLYAVKMLPLRSLWNVKLAKVQVQTCAKLLSHPAIVPFVDVDSTGGFHYLVWPYVEGATLARRVEARGPATVPTALAIMGQIAEGLSICHNDGIAHGLINPSNISIDSGGQARILDLGVGAILSENIAEEESMLDTMSAANATLGMLDCCAPETLNSPTLRDPKSDQYSFGCVFYYLLTGNLPFSEGNVVDRVLAHQVTPAPSARLLNPDVPAWLDEMIQRMMSKTPSRRFDSMQEVLAKLLGASHDEARPRGESVRLESTIIGAAASVRLANEFAAPLPELQGPDDAELRFDNIGNRAKGNEAKSFPPPVTQSREPSPDDIDFSSYASPEQESENQWSGQASTPLELALDSVAELQPAPREAETPVELQPAKSHVKPILIPTLSPADSNRKTAEQPKKAWVSADLPAPIVYTDSGRLSERDVRAAVPNQPPELPSFTHSWWYRLKSWFRALSPQSAEVVQVSVFGPSKILPGDNVKLQVFAHTPESFDSVVTLTHAFSHDATFLGTGYVDKPISRGQELSFHVKIANAGVAQSLITLNWLGQPQQRTFQIHVPWQAQSGRNNVVLSIGHGGIVVGQLSVPLEILPRRA